MKTVTKSKVNRGLYTVNSGELPIWVNNICQWLAYENVVIRGTQKRLTEEQEKIAKYTFWQKLRHGFQVVRGYDVMRIMGRNPFPHPSASDLAKFEEEYPDMAKEWGKSI